MSAHGITVKSSSEVAPEALVKAAESVTRMMVGLRHDIRECLVREGAAMAVYPKDGFVVELPEFVYLKGEKVPHFDILYDDFQGGLGAVLGQPVSATPEFDMLQDHGIINGAVTMHEFAHAVMNLCFTREDHAEVTELYDEALRLDAFPGSYAMTNVDEFFAETSLAYFNVPVSDYVWGLTGNQSFQDALKTTLLRTFAFLERVYGDPLPPPAPTPVPIRQVVNRDHKYAYSIEIPQDWTQDRPNYWNPSEYSDVDVRAVNLADGTSLEQFAQSVRDELEDRWRDAELFETSFKRTRVGGMDAYSIAYRAREGPEWCIEDVVEIVVAASSLPGNPQGFRAIYGFSLCDSLELELREFGALRTKVLDSFRVFAE